MISKENIIADRELGLDTKMDHIKWQLEYCICTVTTVQKFIQLAIFLQHLPTTLYAACGLLHVAYYMWPTT